MYKTILYSPVLLLSLTFLTVTQGQYYDTFDSLRQYFQPYRPPVDLFSQHNDINRFTGIHRPTNRPENKRRNEDDDRYTKKQPVIQHDNNYSPTTSKPSRKTTKSHSSHDNKPSNIRNFNTDMIFSDFYGHNTELTTKRNIITTNKRLKTTTRTPVNNYYDINKATTKNIFESDVYNNRGSNNYNKPVTENVFETKNKQQNNYDSEDNAQGNYQNNRRTDNNNNYNNKVTTNNRDYNTQNKNNNQNNGFNNEYNNRGDNNNYQQPTNHRNPDVHGINTQNRPNQGIRNHNLGSTTSSFYNNKDNNNYNRDNNHRVTPNNFGSYNNDRRVLNTDYDGDASEDNNKYNPLLHRPGVKPVPVDTNLPPITNKPVTKNPFEDDGFGSNTEKPVDSPDILIGSDEGDLSEGQKRRYINMLEKMCDGYKSLDFKEIVALPLLPSPDPVQLNVSSCVPITAPLIIGGKSATINDFPHMALVGWRKIRSSGYSWKCGGSLITNQYVLTAGHCTYQDKDYEVDSGPPQAVQLGSSYLDDPDAVVVKISAVIRHSKYKQRRSYYDIALIKLAHTVKFSEVIRPACLGVPPRVGQNVIATGWGRTEFGGDHSVDLRSVSLPVWNMAECREIWGTSLKLPNGPSPESHMCAGEKAGGKDTCQGDSGGPAQIQDGCVWRIVAVTSYGRSCGAPNTPALYAITQRVFIAAQIFGDDQETSSGDDIPSYEDRRQPSYNNRQPGYSNSRQPGYTVNNSRRPSYIVNNSRRPTYTVHNYR